MKQKTTPLTRLDIVTVQNSELNVKYTLELTVYMSLQNNNLFLLLFFLGLNIHLIKQNTLKGLKYLKNHLQKC